MAVLLLKENLATAQDSRIKGSMDLISGDNRVLEMMKFVMFDRLLAVRAWVYMDFWSYTMAYMYYSMSQGMYLPLFRELSG